VLGRGLLFDGLAGLGGLRGLRAAIALISHRRPATLDGAVHEKPAKHQREEEQDGRRPSLSHHLVRPEWAPIRCCLMLLLSCALAASAME